MEAQEHLDKFLIKRGISPELAAARGYRPWDGLSGAEVIAEAFEGIHSGALQWLSGIASNEEANGVGFTIPRRPVLEDGDSIFPEIKTQFAVKNGTKRHFHGTLPGGIFSLLPTFVEWAECIPTMGQFTVMYHTLRFFHNHDLMDQNGDEFREHMRLWHTAGSRIKAEHRHTLKVFKPENMRAHITNEGGKFSHPHSGENSNEIHTHIQEAKYILPPHPPTEKSWNREHDHSEMGADELAWHLETKHGIKESGN